jgi:tetratricopeptide (TPR) repeat protein
MLLPNPSAIATDTATSKISPWNQKAFERLQLSLSLNLRRQILIAVCDDLGLRNFLAGQLHADLGDSQIVNLNLNLKAPHPLAQITQWIAQQKRSRLPNPGTTFQILGVELLTRQPASVQGLFLRHLQGIERSLPQLESSLLLWLPRPWFYTIQQSAPEFWRWRTGVFEFEGEPTPVLSANSPQPEVYREQVPRRETPPVNVQEDFLRVVAKFNDPGLEQSLEISYGDWEIDEEEELNQLAINDSPVLVPTHLPSWQTLEDLDRFSQGFYPPELLAEAYLSVGNYYRDRIENGDGSPENLQLAIQSYEKGLIWLEKFQTQSDRSPTTGLILHPADLLNDIGNLYWMLSRCPLDIEEKLTSLQWGIQSYQLALTKLTAITVPDTYAMIQNNLGAAYGDLARYLEPTENLQRSIAAYQQALGYRSATVEPLKYASTQNNLGTAYWHLAQQGEMSRQAPVHLQAAIAAYNEALSIYSAEKEPLNWAMIQNNLGTAYWNLAQYEHPEQFLRLAIDAYSHALKYRHEENVPAACAATQNNLGTAYWHLAHHSQAEPQIQRQYLQLCVQIYESAIALAQKLQSSEPPIAVNFDVFATQNNVGLAHYQIACDRRLSLDDNEQAAHLEAALSHHVQALQGFSQPSESYQTSLNYIIKTIRAFYQERGSAGQNFALSRVPGQLLPEILRRL